MFVIDKNGSAYKLTGQTLLNDLAEALDGHGGIASITYVAPTYPSLNGTLTVNLVDETSEDFTITNGRGIDSITWATSGTAGNGQTHTGTIAYNDGTSSTVVFQDGVKGDTGDRTYLHIKYSATMPTSDGQMSDSPNNYIGIVATTSQTAPTAYTAYTWYEWKGEQGFTGEASSIESQTIEYAASESGTVTPESWSSTIPTVEQGEYLWTKTTLSFNDETDVVIYSIARNGVDGDGQVEDVAANFAETFSDGETYAVGDLVMFEHTLYRCITAISTAGAWDDSKWEAVTTVELVDDSKPRYYTASVANVTNGTLFTITDDWITTDTVVADFNIATPAKIESDITWSSTTGSITFTGTTNGQTTAYVVLANKGN